MTSSLNNAVYICFLFLSAYMRDSIITLNSHSHQPFPNKILLRKSGAQNFECMKMKKTLKYQRTKSMTKYKVIRRVLSWALTIGWIFLYADPKNTFKCIKGSFMYNFWCSTLKIFFEFNIRMCELKYHLKICMHESNGVKSLICRC